MPEKELLDHPVLLKEESPGPLSRSPRVAALVAAAVGALLYVESLRFGYVLDDVWIVETDQRLQDPLYFLDVWWQPWWEWGSAKGESRPLTSLSFWAHMQLHGPVPFWPHVVNVVLFALLCYLVAQLAARWLARSWAAWPVGLVFAAHPLHVEAVANLVGRAETLSAIFFVLALLAWHRWRLKITWPRAVVISSLVLLAGLSKETGYLSGLVLVLAELAQRRCEHRRIIAAPWLIPLVTCIAIVAATAIVQRTAVVKASVKENSTVAPVVNPLVDATIVERWVTPWKLTGRAFSLLVFPYNQSPEYSPQTLMPTSQLTDPLVLLGLGAVVLWVFSVGHAWRNRSPVLGALLACAVAWIIPSNSVILIGTIFGERLLMLLSIFAVMAVVGLLPSSDSLPRSDPPLLRLASWIAILAMMVFVPTMLNVASRDFAVLPDQSYMLKLYGKLAVCGIAIFVGAYFACRRLGRFLPTMAVATITTAFAWTLLCYQPVWRDINYLNNLSAVRHPENGHFQAEYALFLVQQAVAFPSQSEPLMQLVKQHAENAILLFPDQPEPFLALACVWMHQGDQEKARGYYRFLQTSGYELERFELYIQHFQLGENFVLIERRIAELESRHRNNPDDQMLARKLALAYIETRDRATAEKARALFDRIIGPDLTVVQDPILLDEYARVLATNGDGARVIETYRHLVRIDPMRVDTRINLAVTLILDGELTESRRWIDEAIALQPNSSAAWNARGLWFEHSGDLPQAIRATEQSLKLIAPDNPRLHLIERRLQQLRNKSSH